MDDAEHGPREGVSVQQVREELGHIPQLVGLQPVYVPVLCRKSHHEGLLVEGAYEAEALAKASLEAARSKADAAR